MRPKFVKVITFRAEEDILEDMKFLETIFGHGVMSKRKRSVAIRQAISETAKKYRNKNAL